MSFYSCFYFLSNNRHRFLFWDSLFDFTRHLFLPLTHQSTAKQPLTVDVVRSPNGDQMISAGHKLIAKVLSGCDSDIVRNARNNKQHF